MASERLSTLTAASNLFGTYDMCFVSSSGVTDLGSVD